MEKTPVTELHPVVLREGMSLSHDIEDYPDGIIIAIDKPYRWTSADVIRKVKYAAIRHFGKKNLKVGHAGTLDPLATGVLLVCIGKATKLAEMLQSHDKEYIAEVVFGATTPSYDLEKEIDRHFPYGHITAEGVREALKGFLGEQDQVAPLFSAKSVDGVRAYEIARKMFREAERSEAARQAGCHAEGYAGNNAGQPGAFDKAAESIIRTARINITGIGLLSFRKAADDADKADVSGMGTAAVREGSSASCNNGNAGERKRDASSRINVADNSQLGLPSATIRIECSKGTYIRAVARDLGEAVGSGAHLGSLRRSRSGDFPVASALTLDQVLSILSVSNA